MPESALGDKKLWDKAEAGLKAALDHAKLKFKISPGAGAFYGPKIDFHIKDAIGRSWQLATIQLDFNLPKRFDAEYIDQDGKKKNPVMIHRAVLGSLERFIGILIEHYAGKFPLWLNPNQVTILPITDRHVKYACEVGEKFKQAGLRVEVDDRAETTNKKVREAQLNQFNYILVVGDQEEKNKTVNVRTRDNKILGEKKTEEFVKELVEELNEKRK